MRFFALAAALAAACATPGSNVVATPSGLGVKSERRPVNCKIDFYRTKPPDRAYDEIATLHYEGRGPADVAQDNMRAKACQLGAHAVIVSRDYVAGVRSSLGVVVGVMTGTAIVYRGLTASDAGLPDPPPPPRATLCSKEGLVAATLRQAATLRDGAYPGASFIHYIDAGVEVCAADRSTGGYRQVRLPDGRTGYVTESAVEIVKTAPAPVPPPQPLPPPKPPDKAAPDPTAI